jgi:hypothetical protein
MTTITLKIDERTKKGKAFLEMARAFFEDSKEIEIIKVPNKAIKRKTKSKNAIEISLEEEKNGKINFYKNSNDLFKKVLNV